MTTKYTKLWGIGAMSRTMPFKWEWAVLYDYYKTGVGWIPSVSSFPTRKNMRVGRRQINYDSRARNIRVARRLVAVHWQPYRDTFTYNAKGNGNGR
jgi:hypothetical protein